METTPKQATATCGPDVTSKSDTTGKSDTTSETGTGVKAGATGTACYHRDGFVSAWQKASSLVGCEGRIATLPDIVDARLSQASPVSRDSVPWGMGLTSASAEYMGMSRGGNRIIIVAHGIGPMATLDGIVNSYSCCNDQERNRGGGRISQGEFFKLEDGVYGDVSVVDFDSFVGRYEYPFMETLRLSQALVEPLVHARLGSRWQQYLEVHVEAFRLWQRKTYGDDGDTLPSRQRNGRTVNASSNPFLLNLLDATSCSYLYETLEEGMAFAHLLSIGPLTTSTHTDGDRPCRSLVCDISCHGWSNGARLVAVSGDGPLQAIDESTNR